MRRHHNEVEAVVFDVGGILLDWDPERVFLDVLPDPADRRRFLDEVCTMAWNATLDAGRPFDEAIAELSARHPDQAHLIERWHRQDEMIVGPIEPNVDLLRRLRAAGTPVYLLTNMPSGVFAHRRERWGFLAEVDGAVVSGDEGVCKPDPELFSVLSDRHGLQPSRTLFVDDSQTNVEAAQALGWLAHLVPPRRAVTEAVGRVDLEGWA